MKKGDVVILDEGFRNQSEVTIVKLSDIYTCVTDGEYSWYVMTYRLSETTNMKTIVTIVLALIVSASIAQTTKPRQHVYHDTVKEIKTRIDYAPDTILVYFKELKIWPDTIQEIWRKGFVIWQTYRKPDMTVFGFTSASTSGNWCCQTIGMEPVYTIHEYEPSKGMPGTFLYSDRKTICRNKVLLSFTR